MHTALFRLERKRFRIPMLRSHKFTNEELYG